MDDARIRAMAFKWLTDLVEELGNELPKTKLDEGFIFENRRVPLMGPQGIFKPQVLTDAPISITTAPNGPYDDAFGDDGLIRYRYRGNDPHHRDNRLLRAAMQHRIPLIYFYGIRPGRYEAYWPAFIVGDDPSRLTFSVAVDDPDAIHSIGQENGAAFKEPDDERRRYITGSVRIRLHQRTFRERVLEAYRRRCAFCHFRHEELLDAAHIVPDKDPEGKPIVSNGLALCTLHHAAFDRNFLGLRPDLKLEVRADILKEHDGPTLVHGIQALHGSNILLPRVESNRPNRKLVEIRFEKFKQSH